MASQKMPKTLLPCFNQLHHKTRKRNRTQISKLTSCRSSWQEPPRDITEEILQYLDFSARTNLSLVSKSWRAAAKCTYIRGPRELPWLLLLPQKPNNKEELSFFSPSAKKVYKWTLPADQVQRESLCGFSKGWFFIINETVTKTYEVFLLDPVCGVQHQLPTLRSEFTFTCIKVSSADFSGCITVAGIANRELFLWKAGDSSWNVIQVLDENNTDVLDILFSRGVLYVLVDSDDQDGFVATRTLEFGQQALELKLVYSNTEQLNDHTGFDYFLKKSHLLESTNNDVLLVHQICRKVTVKTKSTALKFVFLLIIFSDLAITLFRILHGVRIIFFPHFVFLISDFALLFLASLIEEEEEEDWYEDEDEDDEEGNDNNQVIDVEAVEGNEEGEEGNQDNGDAGELNEGVDEEGNDNNIEEGDNFGVVEGDEDNEDGGLQVQSETYLKTKGFSIYRIEESQNGNFAKVDNLDDQIILLGEDGASSLVASDFELQGNCIYFASNERVKFFQSLTRLRPSICRRMSVFYLDDERIEASSLETESPSWYTPNLWNR